MRIAVANIIEIAVRVGLRISITYSNSCIMCSSAQGAEEEGNLASSICE